MLFFPVIISFWIKNLLAWMLDIFSTNDKNGFIDFIKIEW